MDIVPLTLWREARGEGRDGMLAVACVIRNRVQANSKLWPADPERVCLQPYQFSCWNTNDAGRKAYPPENDPQHQVARDIWHLVWTGHVDDPTRGATYYCNPAVCADPFANKPEYVETAVIGRHTFYRSA